MKSFFRTTLIIAMAALLVGFPVNLESLEDEVGAQASASLGSVIALRANRLNHRYRVPLRDLLERFELVVFGSSVNGREGTTSFDLILPHHSSTLQSLCLLRC